MRWLNLSIILIYLSILLSPPAKAVTQNRVDLVGSGISVQNAIMPVSQHLPGHPVTQSDTPDDGAVISSSLVSVSKQRTSLLSAVFPVPHLTARLLAQPRAPPVLR